MFSREKLFLFYYRLIIARSILSLNSVIIVQEGIVCLQKLQDLYKNVAAHKTWKIIEPENVDFIIINLSWINH